MSRSVFVHETIDIVGQGQYDYMEMVNREPAQHMPDMTSLQGTFYILGFGGGHWPQVINIWYYLLPMTQHHEGEQDSL